MAINVVRMEHVETYLRKSSHARLNGARNLNANKDAFGHLLALITILIWGTTFVSTKVLLSDFTPIEILFFRFGIGLIVLILIFPRRLKGTSLGQEILFAGAGLCGVTLYFLFENIALTYTSVSNVGIIVSISPFVTAILSHWFLKDEKLRAAFFIGFIIAMIGIALISFNGSVILNLDPMGDLLAVSAAIVWAVYSIITRKISQYGHNVIQVTRRTFVYGLLFMLPALFLFPFEWGLQRFADPVNLLNILFLGLGASAMCFVSWNLAVKILGAVKVSAYIYLIPTVAIVTAMMVLNEAITWMVVLGAILTLSGLVISERRFKGNNEGDLNS